VMAPALPARYLRAPLPKATEDRTKTSSGTLRRPVDVRGILHFSESRWAAVQGAQVCTGRSMGWAGGQVQCEPLAFNVSR
jgi:hypothetical protein